MSSNGVVVYGVRSAAVAEVAAWPCGDRMGEKGGEKEKQMGMKRKEQ